jgi:prepilin-type N-terminal cleavage/methylation domain-containing protein
MNTHSRRGVTIVELLIAMSLSAVVLGAVMSTYLYIARSSVRIANYHDMEREATLGLEQLGRDLRMTDDLVSVGTPINQITLTIPNADNSGNHTVVYAYDSNLRTFTRQKTVNGTAGPTKVLVRNIQPGSFSFRRFDQAQQSLDLPGAPLPDYSTKQLQITLTVAPDTKGLVVATTKRVISSRYVLRNL